MGMAIVCLRRVFQPHVTMPSTIKNEHNATPAMIEISASGCSEIQHDDARPEEYRDRPVTEEGREALAFARPVTLDDFPEDTPELVEITATTFVDTIYVESTSLDDDKDDEDDEDEDEDSDDESDDDSSDGESDSGSEQDSDCLKPKPSRSSFFFRPPLRRSPLSRSNDGFHHYGVYAGYRCKIAGCDFAASTEGHIRHHMTTASHCHLLELPGQDE